MKIKVFVILCILLKTLKIINKTPFIIYADLKCLMEEIDGCKNNPENLYTTKVNEHIPSGFSMSTIS